MINLTAQQLYERLLNDECLNECVGSIIFNFAGISVKITTTDTVGLTLQSWLKEYMISNNINFDEPHNTQSFPDFFLEQHDLEIKSFNYKNTPAFDIANFDSYCNSIKDDPSKLDADYLIFGYTMTQNGDIQIKRIWLHKIWEITGVSKKFPLKVQDKKGMIYNIRPNSEFKNDKSGPFKNKEEFINALYQTLVKYKGLNFANQWKEVFKKNYKKHYHTDINI